MIDVLQVVFLALLQGLTEFLPISSSAHLVIPSLILGWDDQGLAFDVAVHVGTLVAVVVYYRADLLRMAYSWFRSVAGAPATADSRMVWYLGLATIPAGLVGILAGGFIEGNLRTIPVIATTTLIFGLLLGFADRRVAGTGSGKPLGLLMALVIGSAQALLRYPCFQIRHHYDGRVATGYGSTIVSAVFLPTINSYYFQRWPVEGMGAW